MEIIVAGHMYMEKEVLGPYRGVCCSIIRFDVYGFEPFWEFMIHHFIGEAEGVCSASVPGYVTTQSGQLRLVVFGPTRFIVSVSGMPVIIMCCSTPRDP